MSFLSEIETHAVIPQNKLAYFRQRLRRRLYEFIARKFAEAERCGKITKADLARRIHRDPAQITKWLSTPGNWTLDTVSDLLLAINAEELTPEAISVLGNPPRNYTQPDWLGNTGTNRLEQLQKELVKLPDINLASNEQLNANSTATYVIINSGGERK